MARLTPQNSPKGFWPNPELESFFKLQTPPWEVPRKRKPKGDPSRLKLIKPIKYDGGEITTRNRFKALEMSIDSDDELQNKYKKIQGVLKRTRKRKKHKKYKSTKIKKHLGASY